MPERAAVYEEEEAERPAQGTEELVAELAHRKQAEPGWQAYLTILLYNWLFKPTEVAPPPTSLARRTRAPCRVFRGWTSGVLAMMVACSCRRCLNSCHGWPPTRRFRSIQQGCVCCHCVVQHVSLASHSYLLQIRVPRSALRAHASADASDALASQETISLLELAANMDDDARALAYWSTLFMMVEHFHNEATSDGSGLADRSPEHAARWSRMGELVAEARTGLSIANRRLDPDAAIAAVDPARTYFLDHLSEEYREWEAAQRQNSKPDGGD